MNQDDLRARLNRINSRIITDSDRPEKQVQSLSSRYARMAAAFGGELRQHEAGTFCFLKHLYQTGTEFGRTALNDIPLSRTARHEFFAAERSDESSSYGKLLFFDLETTGLGGAGAVPFLIGTGSLTTDGFEVRQYLLPDYPDEQGMLESFAAELTPDTTLVTFNGAAFDLNLIRDRFIINRVNADLQMRHHIDLLHPARRLFRRRLRDCSLGNIERELFSFYRDDDIPGYLIPYVYFSWLGEENLDQMADVLLHNRLDIFSMLFLLDLIVAVFESDGDRLDHIVDKYSLSRVYARRRDHGRAASLLDNIDTSGMSADMLFDRGMMLKRAGRLQDAAELWSEAVHDESRAGYLAALELAKYCEHELNDFCRAVEHAEYASRICPYGPSERQRLRHRLARLRGRLGWD